MKNHSFSVSVAYYSSINPQEIHRKGGGGGGGGGLSNSHKFGIGCMLFKGKTTKNCTMSLSFDR